MMPVSAKLTRTVLAAIISLWPLTSTLASPAHKAALIDRYGRLLPKASASCITCHTSDPGIHMPTRLADIPHNAFGARLAALGSRDIETRLAKIATEDTDHDGTSNELELLAGTSPANASERPTVAQRTDAALKQLPLAFRTSDYAFRPFKPVPPRPTSNVSIDSLLNRYQTERDISANPAASKEVLLRRATMDITGLPPTPAERSAFLADTRTDAYKRLIDRLLASPTYGERWGRHFMDIWRYSDWAGWNDGGQVRDSQPHIWRWRDWIVESLNGNMPYNRMVTLMLAADEVAPTDQNALRATGFLVRNYKLLSREAWMEDTVNHTSKAFLGITMHCAKCHSHMYDPIPQTDYYRFRAIFENYNVRTERIPGEPDTAKTALVRAYDADMTAATYLFPRGDDRNPDKSRTFSPGVPAFLGGEIGVKPITLPAVAAHPELAAFVIDETRASLQKKLAAAQLADKNDPRAQLVYLQAQVDMQIFDAQRVIENIELTGDKSSAKWVMAAKDIVRLERYKRFTDARVLLFDARKRLAAASDKDKPMAQAAVTQLEKDVAAAEAKSATELDTAYTKRIQSLPNQSTGKRTAFAAWLVDKQNPLTARVLVNHIWMRHFGTALAPSVADFGHNSQAVEQGQLLDYLARRFMDSGWDMKRLHREIMLSAAYQRDSRPSAKMLQRDPDNVSYWRFAPRRLEAEGVRDAILAVSGQLDRTQGGAEIDQNLALETKRRSIYLRSAPEKEAEFIKVFDGPSVTECYERKQSILPQQALAMANSKLALREARTLAASIYEALPEKNHVFTAIRNAFIATLTREPTTDEMTECVRFMASEQPVAGATPGASPTLLRRLENLVAVLINHHEFVTIR
jgi:mono/diheme cytochrome c family protein